MNVEFLHRSIDFVFEIFVNFEFDVLMTINSMRTIELETD